MKFTNVKCSKVAKFEPVHGKFSYEFHSVDTDDSKFDVTIQIDGYDDLNIDFGEIATLNFVDSSSGDFECVDIENQSFNCEEVYIKLLSNNGKKPYCSVSIMSCNRSYSDIGVKVCNKYNLIVE